MTAREDEAKEESSKMKELLEQANSMLKSLTSSSTSSTTSSSAGEESREEVVNRLQQQINMLKLKVFRINQITYGCHQGLMPLTLRPKRTGETENMYKRVAVTLANGETTTLQVTPGGIMATDRNDIEPILPIGQLVHDLRCEIAWKEGSLKILHPLGGELPVRHKLRWMSSAPMQGL